ncbi:unnamed protein product, partial [Nesidiocoris tenuis]
MQSWLKPVTWRQSIELVQSALEFSVELERHGMLVYCARTCDTRPIRDAIPQLDTPTSGRRDSIIESSFIPMSLGGPGLSHSSDTALSQALMSNFSKGGLLGPQ